MKRRDGGLNGVADNVNINSTGAFRSVSRLLCDLRHIQWGCSYSRGMGGFCFEVKVTSNQLWYSYYSPYQSLTRVNRRSKNHFPISKIFIYVIQKLLIILL